MSDFERAQSYIAKATLSRRAILKRAGLLGLSVPVLAGLLAACGGDDDDDETPATTATAASTTSPGGATATATAAATSEATAASTSASASPAATSAATESAVEGKMGGTLRASSNSLAQDTLNQHLTNNTNSLQTARHVIDGLAMVDPATGDVLPHLAESWEVSEDGLEYTFTLLQGVKFHDGADFNAEAMKINYDFTANNEVKAFAWSALGAEKFEGCEAVDEYTFVVNFNAPFPSFLGYVGGPGLGPDSPQALEEGGTDYGFTSLVGTGPFIFKEWIQKDRAMLERNPDYAWPSGVMSHQGPPFLDAIEYIDILEPGTRAAALQNGDIHVATLGESQVADFDNVEEVDIVTVPKAGTTRMYLMNTKMSPTDDLRVRQAINYAIDKEALIQLPFWAGIGRPARAPLPVNMMPADLYEMMAESDYPYDPDRANALLDEAGWTLGSNGMRSKDGQDMVLTFISTTADIPSVEPFGGFLNEIGIQLDIQSGDFNYLLEAVKGPFHVTLFSGSGYDSPGLVHRFFNTNGIFSFFVSDPELDELTDQAISVPSREEMWPILGEAMTKVNEMAIGVMGWEQDYVFGVRNNVKNVLFNEWGFPYFYETWLDE